MLFLPAFDRFDAASTSTKKTRYPSRAGVANLFLTSIPYIFFRDVAGRLENSWICFVSPRFFRRRGGENRDTTELVFQTEFRSFTSSGDRSSSSPSTSFSSSPRPSSHCWPSKKYSSRTRSLHSIIPCIYFPRFFHAREILRETLRSYNCSCNICDHAAAQYKSLTKEKINFFFPHFELARRFNFFEN